MTTHPDVAGAVLALDRAMIALAVAKSVLLGETSGPLDLAAAEASPANPYGSAKHGTYTAPSAAAVAQDVEPAAGNLVMGPPECNDCHTRHRGSCPAPATGHLPQHTGGEPGCTYGGCTDHAHDAGVTR